MIGMVRAPWGRQQNQRRPLPPSFPPFSSFTHTGQRLRTAHQDLIDHSITASQHLCPSRPDSTTLVTMNALPAFARVAAAVSAVALQHRRRHAPPLLPIATISVMYSRPSSPPPCVIGSWFPRRSLTQQTTAIPTTAQHVGVLSRIFGAMPVFATVSEVGSPIDPYK